LTALSKINFITQLVLQLNFVSKGQKFNILTTHLIVCEPPANSINQLKLATRNAKTLTEKGLKGRALISWALIKCLVISVMHFKAADARVIRLWRASLPISGSQQTTSSSAMQSHLLPLWLGCHPRRIRRTQAAPA